MTDTTKPTTTTNPKRLTCMEIMGGNQAFDGAVSVPGLDAWIHTQPYGGDALGGDIHYLSVCGGHKITRLAVADVSGHGQGVGELAQKLRSFMRRYINRADQTRIVRQLNRSFLRQAVGSHFATAIVATFFAPTEHLIICNAGHPPPLLFRTKSKIWHELDARAPETETSASNLPLGIISETQFHQYAVKLEEDDLVFLYTDGLPETANPQGEMLGQAGLKSIVEGIDVTDSSQFIPSLQKRLIEYRGGAKIGDDETAILLRHNRAKVPRPTVGETVKMVGKLLRLVKV